MCFYRLWSDGLWLPPHHCAAPVWLTGVHARPLVTWYVPPKLYCQCYRFETAFFTLRHFLLCTPFCWFWGFPGADNSTSKLAGLHADHWNIVPDRPLYWMTAIHKRGILAGFIYVVKVSFEVRVPQVWYLSLIGFEPACVSSWLYRLLGHRVLFALIGG